MRKASHQKKQTLVFMGRSGCGKGTQARFAVQHLGRAGVSHLETGKFLRQLYGRYKNPTIEFAKSIQKRGGWVPSWFPAFTLLKRMIEGGIIRNHWIVDGSPRKMWEAALLDDIMREHGRPLPLVILIELGPARATERLLLRAKIQGRSDDAKASIRNRMKSFAKHTVPILRYYKKQKRLITVNGDQPKEKVWADIDAALQKRLKKNWPKHGE